MTYNSIDSIEDMGGKLKIGKIEYFLPQITLISF